MDENELARLLGMKSPEGDFWERIQIQAREKHEGKKSQGSAIKDFVNLVEQNIMVNDYVPSAERILAEAFAKVSPTEREELFHASLAVALGVECNFENVKFRQALSYFLTNENSLLHQANTGGPTTDKWHAANIAFLLLQTAHLSKQKPSETGETLYNAEAISSSDKGEKQSETKDLFLNLGNDFRAGISVGYLYREWLWMLRDAKDAALKREHAEKNADRSTKGNKAKRDIASIRQQSLRSITDEVVREQGGGRVYAKKLVPEVQKKIKEMSLENALSQCLLKRGGKLWSDSIIQSDLSVLGYFKG